MAAGDVRVISLSHKSKRSIVCDGTEDYAQIDAFGVAREAAGTADTVGTFAGWIHIASASASYCLIAAGDVSAAEYVSLQVVSGKINSTLFDGGSVQFDIESDTAPVTTDGWHHIAVTQDATQPLLYHNGILLAATNDNATDITKWFADLNGIDNANIGILDQNSTTTLDMDGAIGAVKYWDKALSAAEILQEYNNQAVTDHLISSWDFDGDLVDSVGGHDGTLVNEAYLDPQYSNFTKEIQRVRALGGVTDLLSCFVDGNKYVAVAIENT